MLKLLVFIFSLLSTLVKIPRQLNPIKSVFVIGSVIDVKKSHKANLLLGGCFYLFCCHEL